MRSYSKWLMLMCLGLAACSDDKSSSSDEGVSASDASTDDSTNSDKKSGSAGKGGAGGSKAGAGGKAASSDNAKSDSASGDDAKSDDAKKDDASGDKDKDNAKKSDSKDNTSESGKSDDNSSKNAAPTNGDQLSVCARSEGDCNKGLACQAPATTSSAGRGFCSKICESDDDCGGVSPEGTKYTCSTGNGGTNTCEIVCSGTEDSSCPSGLRCVQTSRRRGGAPAVRRGAGGEGGQGGGGSAAPQGEFRCRYPFEVSKIWGQCGDADHVCDTDLTCQGFFFGGVGHCTKSCEKDEDCAKPESGNTKPTCRNQGPIGFGNTLGTKQCALSCVDAKDDCPNGLACVEQRQAQARPQPRDGGTETVPAVAWCQ